MKRRYSFFILALILLGLACRAESDQVCFNDQCVQVEVVKNEEDMARGLQFRKELAPDAGMLFIFPEKGIYPFWMKDTLIPLDLIWLDENKHVVALKENIPPCTTDPCPTYDPEQGALYVLEINAGHSKIIGLTIGAPAVFHLSSERY